MINRNKKGISPLIATVLVIGFTIVLAALVISWGTNLFKKTTEETGKTSEFNLLCTTGYNIQYKVEKGNTFYGVTAINKNERTVGGFLFLIRDDVGKKSQSFSTEPTLVKTTLNAGIDLVAPNAVLGPFGTQEYKLIPAAEAVATTWKKLEVRPVATLENGEKKVCDQETIVNLP